MLLEAPGLNTSIRSKDAILGAPGLDARSKDATRGSWPLRAPGLTTRSGDATRGSGHKGGARMLLGALGLTTRSKDVTRGAPGIVASNKKSY